MNKIIIILFVLLVSACSSIETPIQETAPLHTIANIDGLKMEYGTLRIYKDNMYFTAWGETENHSCIYDIYKLDIANGKLNRLIERKCPDIRGWAPIFVAEDDRYILLMESRQVFQKLILLDRLSGAEISTLRLQQPITWAKLDRNKLIVAQLQNGIGYVRQQYDRDVSLVSIPELKVTKKIPAIDIADWGDNVVTLSNNLVAYDNQLNVKGQLKVRPRMINGEMTICFIDTLAVTTNTAAILGCGNALTVDIQTFKIIAQMAIPSIRAASGWKDHIIYATNDLAPIVYAMNTRTNESKMIAKLEDDIGSLFIDDNYIVLIKGTYSASVTIYQINESLLNPE